MYVQYLMQHSSNNATKGKKLLISGMIDAPDHFFSSSHYKDQDFYKAYILAVLSQFYTAQLQIKVCKITEDKYVLIEGIMLEKFKYNRSFRFEVHVLNFRKIVVSYKENKLDTIKTIRLSKRETEVV